MQMVGKEKRDRSTLHLLTTRPCSCHISFCIKGLFVCARMQTGSKRAPAVVSFKRKTHTSHAQDNTSINRSRHVPGHGARYANVLFAQPNKTGRSGSPTSADARGPPPRAPSAPSHQPHPGRRRAHAARAPSPSIRPL